MGIFVMRGETVCGTSDQYFCELFLSEYADECSSLIDLRKTRKIYPFDVSAVTTSGRFFDVDISDSKFRSSRPKGEPVKRKVRISRNKSVLLFRYDIFFKGLDHTFSLMSEKGFYAFHIDRLIDYIVNDGLHRFSLRRILNKSVSNRCVPDLIVFGDRKKSYHVDVDEYTKNDRLLVELLGEKMMNRISNTVTFMFDNEDKALTFEAFCLRDIRKKE